MTFIIHPHTMEENIYSWHKILISRLNENAGRHIAILLHNLVNAYTFTTDIKFSVIKTLLFPVKYSIESLEQSKHMNYDQIKSCY